ncbi:MAG TPA: DUF2334 domain-containing protein [Pyrinomonadaceae bacterium]|nr:DUF2334 domain-containing protein [Pyrinomonadaceae bacterium]
MNWLDPLRKTLDSNPNAITFFFRNDDVGWEDARLFELLDLFAEFNVPLDLAAIPTAISPRTAARLQTLVDRNMGKLSIHQHGYAHLNHEQSGRKCEFGETRSRDSQQADIEAGKHRLNDLFGPTLEPIFTPPWNRCTAATAACLREAGFRLLSRDTTASQLNTDGLMELPVSIDWFAKRKNVRLTREEIGSSFSAAASGGSRLGVMLHHALMDEEERARLGELLQLVSTHSQARCVLMRDFIPGGTS